MRGTAAQNELGGVVSAGANTGPGIQSGELRIVKGERRLNTVNGSARGEAVGVENVDKVGGAKGARPPIALEHFIHGLRGRRTSGGCGPVAIGAVDAGGIGEEI